MVKQIAFLTILLVSTGTFAQTGSKAALLNEAVLAENFVLQRTMTDGEMLGYSTQETFNRKGQRIEKREISAFDGELDVTISEYEYNDDGFLEVEKRGNGEERYTQTNYFYQDGLLRMEVKEILMVDVDMPNDTIHYSYDANGLLIEKLETDLKEVFEYGANNELLTSRIFEGKNFRQEIATSIYEYTAEGLLVMKSSTSPFGSQVTTWHYDEKGRISKEICQNQLGSIRHEFSFEYDDQGLLQMQTWKRTSAPAYSGSVENSTYHTPFTYLYFTM